MYVYTCTCKYFVHVHVIMYVSVITDKAFAQKEQIGQTSNQIDQRIQEFESIFGDKEGNSHISIC